MKITHLFRAAIVSAALVAGLSTTAHAIDYVGTTVGAPKWNRPVQDGNNVPTILSLMATATPFSVQPFFVGTAASYSLLSTSNVPSGWDNYTFLYENGFDSTSPLVNVLIGADDTPTVGLSGFTKALTSGKQYYFVTTGFGNSDAGSFTNSITGGEGITLGLRSAVVPESSALWLALAGLPVVAGIVRRRTK